MRYTDVWNKLTQEMGYWVDMEDPYITYKSKYIESVLVVIKADYTIKTYCIKAIPFSPILQKQELD